MEKIYKHTDLTDRILKAFYDVYNALGYGFSEKVYENSFAIKLKKFGFDVEQQKPIQVFFEGELVGEYFADIVVNDLIIIELKAVIRLHKDYEAQLLNYLKATQYEVGLLLNFGPKPEIKRKAFNNDRKGSLIWIKQ